MINVCSAKDVSKFSLFPEEEEILLLPNSTVMVKSVYDENQKKLLGLAATIDVVELIQIKTPSILNVYQGFYLYL